MKTHQLIDCLRLAAATDESEQRRTDFKYAADEIESLLAEIEQLTDDASSWHTKYLRESLESERLTAENKVLRKNLIQSYVDQGCSLDEATDIATMDVCPDGVEVDPDD